MPTPPRVAPTGRDSAARGVRRLVQDLVVAFSPQGWTSLSLNGTTPAFTSASYCASVTVKTGSDDGPRACHNPSILLSTRMAWMYCSLLRILNVYAIVLSLKSPVD